MSFTRETLFLHSVAPDLVPADAPLETWNTGRNVFFRNKESYRVPGDAATLAGAQADPRAAVFVMVQETVYWVYCTNSGIYAHDGTTEHDITPAAGWAGAASGTTFSACVLNGIAYLNASDRDPVYWPGGVALPCEPLPDWPSGGRCLALRAHKNFLFAIGFTSEGAQRVRWSDAAEAGAVPQHWTPASDNLAGFVDLAPLSSPCLEGKTLRDSFLIYKGESVWSLDFVGGNFVFQASNLFSEHGIANTNAITGGIDEVHLFVGADGDVYITDGTTCQSALDGRAQRAFYSDFSQNRNALFAGATLSREKLGILAYPGAGADRCNSALLFDFVSGDIGFRDMPNVLCMAEGGELRQVGTSNTWDGDGDDWDSDQSRWSFELAAMTLDDVICGGSFGFALVSDGTARDFIDSEVSARLEKSGLAFGNARKRKMVSRVWPKIDGEMGDVVAVRIGGQEAAGGPVTLAPPVNYVIGLGGSVDAMVQGRFLSVEISSLGGGPWRLGSIDVEYREVGGF